MDGSKFSLLLHYADKVIYLYQENVKMWNKVIQLFVVLYFFNYLCRVLLVFYGKRQIISRLYI